jgi:hypothetical protein
MLDHALTKLRVAFGSPKDEALVPKAWPTNGCPVSQPMATWKRHEKALFPKRNSLAVGRTGRISNKRHIQSPSLDERNVLRRCRTLNELDRYIRVPLRIDLQKRPQKASPHGWLDTDTKVPNSTSACLSGLSGRALKVLKRLPGFLNECGASYRQLEATATPLEQRYAERRFELPQPTTH